MIAYQPLVAFDCVVDDRAQRAPPPQGRHSTPERSFSESNMRELTAGLWPHFVDRAEIAVQKDAPFLGAPQDTLCRSVRIGLRILPDDVLRVIAKVLRDAFYISPAYCDSREAAAVRATRTVNVALNLSG
jgi:hypothetical protein